MQLRDDSSYSNKGRRLGMQHSKQGSLLNPLVVRPNTDEAAQSGCSKLIE